MPPPAGSRTLAQDAVAAALPDASSVDAHVRPHRTSTQATTALHAAATAGAAAAVGLLLSAGADPGATHGDLRALRPLHLAATPATAATLLAGGARPLPEDPREPDLLWYHRQHGRAEVAALIARARGTAKREVRPRRARRSWRRWGAV